jgi:hypothetical protein
MVEREGEVVLPVRRAVDEPLELILFEHRVERLEGNREAVALLEETDDLGPGGNALGEKVLGDDRNQFAPDLRRPAGVLLRREGDGLSELLGVEPGELLDVPLGPGGDAREQPDLTRFAKIFQRMS